MDPCKICSKAMDVGKCITCSGSCGMSFHFTCVGISKSHFASWTSKIGFFWFCKPCRLNFDPAVYDRERTIMKALRELMVRTDSIDTRLGLYGENLRKINKTLNGTQRYSKPSDDADHTSFLRSIDEMNFDDTIDDPVSQSRSCEDTSFFEVLDEINSSTAHIPDKIVIGSNKRVQIVGSHSTAFENPSTRKPHTNISTPAAPTHSNASPCDRIPVSPRNNIHHKGERSTGRTVDVNSCTSPHVNTEPNRTQLKVASSSQPGNDVMSFYVTPFEPDQNDEDVKKHVMDISNIHPSSVTVTKLVPRGKQIEDLSFVSFKVTVTKAVSNVVGDSFYWPEGISVRPFEPNQKNASAVRLPNSQ